MIEYNCENCNKENVCKFAYNNSCGCKTEQMLFIEKYKNFLLVIKENILEWKKYMEETGLEEELDCLYFNLTCTSVTICDIEEKIIKYKEGNVK